MPRKKKQEIKEKKTKCFQNIETAKAYFDMLKISGKRFEVIISNYTTEYKGYFNMHFISEEKSNRVFAAFSKIKSDVTKWSANEMPEIDKSALLYFDSYRFKKDLHLSHVYNIDLKSAYATVLFNDLFISEETFKYISKLPKMDRLACVGMLASRKEIFRYDESGDMYENEKRVSEMEGYFYHCVERVSKIMQDVKDIVGNKYLFTWVDGIYFDGEENLEKVSKYLEEINYKHSVDLLNDFSVTACKNYDVVSFKKEGKFKEFVLTRNNSGFAKDMLRHINSQLI